VTEALRPRGVDGLTAQEDDAALLADPEILLRASALRRVLVSQDSDLIAEARRKLANAEPVAGGRCVHPLRWTVGRRVEASTAMALVGEPEDAADRAETLPRR
jgi:hypothetical protein